MGCCLSKEAASEGDSEATPDISQHTSTQTAPETLPEYAKPKSFLSGYENVCPYAGNLKKHSPNESTPIQTSGLCPKNMVDKVKMENGNETSNNMEVEPEKPYNILITDDDDVFSEINMAREIIKKCNEDILSTDERIDALIGAESTLT